MSVLKKCPDVLSSIFKRGGSLELAAKILVLSRHLHKKVAKDAFTSSFAENVRLRLGRLRQRLLNTINRRLSSLKPDAKKLLDAMYAFSLATNSSCSDVLRHFHHVRLNAISTITHSGASQKSQMIHGLQIWTRTMQDTQSFFPRQLATALAKLKSKPLFQDQAIRSIQEFDLEIHEMWIEDDIKNFIPYVRHDDLTISGAAQQLSSWVPSALRSYVSQLEQCLDSIDDFKSVLEIRHDCLRLWLNSRGRVIGISKSEAMNILRAAFQERLGALLSSQAESTTEIVSSVSKVLREWQDGSGEDSSSYLWDESLMSMDTAQNARALTTSVRSRLHGQSLPVIKILQEYEAWVRRINSVGSAISGLSSQKWETEEVDEDEDDLDEVEDMQHRLGKEDPGDLADRLKGCLNDSIDNITRGIGQEQRNLAGDEKSGPKAVFLLRVLREMKQKLPDGASPRDVNFPYISDLHRLVAAPIVDKYIPVYHKAISKAATGINVPIRLLWDGAPELPIVPSAWPFRLLRSVHNEMSAIGLDIWTAKAAEELKILLQSALTDELKRVHDTLKKSDEYKNGSEKPIVNGNTETEGEDDQSIAEVAIQDSDIQLLFDVEYLEAALHSKDDESATAMTTFSSGLMQKIDFPAESARRIKTSAKEYWKRSCLLFALLV